MPFPDYPTDAELAAFLTSSGLATTETAVKGMAAAAATEWEAETGWRPFRAADSAATYAYDAPAHGQWLDLDAPFLTVTEVKVGVTLDDPAGTVLTLDEDYYLPRYQAPYERIQFACRFLRHPKSIRVTGRKGYCIDLPDDVYQAILARAASNASVMVQGAAGPVRRIEQGPVKYEFDLTSGRGQADRWDAQFARTVARYKRITL